jgi:hypothetical protein
MVISGYYLMVWQKLSASRVIFVKGDTGKIPNCDAGVEWVNGL